MASETTGVPGYGELRRIEGASVPVAHLVPGLDWRPLIGQQSGAGNLWMAIITCAPQLVSPVHHHGESEAGFYVLRGVMSLFFGEGLRGRVDLYPGDSVFIPAWLIHAEGNLGSEPCECIGIRSTMNPTSFNLLELKVPADALTPLQPR